MSSVQSREAAALSAGEADSSGVWVSAGPVGEGYADGSGAGGGAFGGGRRSRGW